MTLTVQKTSQWEPAYSALVQESLRLASVSGPEFRKFSSWVRLTHDRMRHHELSSTVGVAGGVPVALAGHARHGDVVRVNYLYVSPAAGSGAAAGFLSLAEAVWLPARRGVVLGGPQTFLDNLIGPDAFLANGYSRFERARFERQVVGLADAALQPGVDRLPVVEIEALARLQREGYAGGTDHLIIEDPEAMVVELINDPWFRPDESFVVRHGERLVGSLYTLRKGRSAWIASLCVHPSARGEGIARRMMLHAMEAYRGAGYERAGLMVTLANDAAVRLYHRMGFVCSRRHTLVYAKDTYRATIE
jgi:ribosomal protein S18 acetylase RimI-like enzyme